VYLLPASRYTANPGSVRSFLSGAQGRSRAIRFPAVGTRSGVLVKSVDAVTLPPLFPSLQTIELIADSGQAIANALMPIALFRRFLERHLQGVLSMAHRFGQRQGVLALEVASATKRKHVVFKGENTHMLAVIPAIEAARAIAEGRFPHRGVVPPTEHVGAIDFWEAVRKEGISAIA